jgi:biotin carboxylase
MSNSFAKTPCLLLLGADAFLRERAIVAALRQHDGPVVAISPRGVFDRNRHVDAVIQASPFDAASALAAVERFVEQNRANISAVVPFSEMTLLAGAAIARRFGLAYLSDECLQLVRHKTRMKQRFSDAGLPVPRFTQFRTLDELRARVGDMKFPLVLKPTEFGGSEGVIMVETPAMLADAFAHSQAVVGSQQHLYGFRDPTYQVEEYIDSEIEISVEVINTGAGRRVLAVTDKSLGPKPYFAEIGHVVPSIFSRDESILSTALAACAALGLDHGIAHVEMRIVPSSGPVLMEVGARTGGDGIMDLVERSLGINPYELHIRSYLGKDALSWQQPVPRGRVAMAFLKAPQGRIVQIHTPTRLPPAIVGCYVTARVGDISEQNHSAHTREGAIECFWTSEDSSGSESRHLALAAELSRNIFVVEN